MEEKEKWIGGKALALLRQGPFRRYIIGSLISDSGTWMQMMAQSWVMSGLTNKAILLGLVNLPPACPHLRSLPRPGRSLINGTNARSWSQRKLCRSFSRSRWDFWLCPGTFRFGILSFLRFCWALHSRYEMPAISALVPELVKRDEIAAAVALDRSVFHGSRLIGPSLAGFFVAWWGAAAAFFTNAFSFVALIIALISLPKRPLGTPEEEEQRRSGIMEGFRYVRSESRCFVADRADRVKHDFHFPSHLGDAAHSMCAIFFIWGRRVWED